MTICGGGDETDGDVLIFPEMIKYKSVSSFLSCFLFLFIKLLMLILIYYLCCCSGNYRIDVIVLFFFFFLKLKGFEGLRCRWIC